MVKYRDRRWEPVAQSVRRRMVERLFHGGAMSLTKMAEPFEITLPAAMKHLRILESAGIVRTAKQGRVRICILDRTAFKEFSGWVASQTTFWQSSFDRLQHHLSKRKKIRSAKK